MTDILQTHYMETTAPGGISRVVAAVARHLPEMGIAVTTIQPNPMDLPNVSAIGPSTLIRVGTSKDLLLGGLHRTASSFIKRYLQFDQPRCIHVHGFHTLYSSQLLRAIRKNRTRVPVVFSPHLDVAASTVAGRYLWPLYAPSAARAIAKAVDHIVVQSQFELEHVKRLFCVKDAQVSCIPLGTRFAPRATVTSKNAPGNILFMGHLIRRKGVPFLLRGFSELLHTVPAASVRLTIIGEGPERLKLMRMARNLGLDDYVVWKDFVPDEAVEQELSAASVLVLLSHSEAFGIVVAEALSLGVPVVVSRNAALAEFLNEPGCFGVDYPPTPSAVARAIRGILDTEVRVGPFSARIRQWETVANEYARLYERVGNGA